jgi:hypothetical protein
MKRQQGLISINISATLRNKITITGLISFQIILKLKSKITTQKKNHHHHHLQAIKGHGSNYNMI